MIPVEQTRFSPAEGGNCQAACIASILECSLGEVPQLRDGEGLSDEGWDAYRSRLADWLRERNLLQLYFQVQENGWRPDGYSVACVKSPRFPEYEHAVVARDGEIVWDPSPQRADGVGDLVGWTIFQIIDPAKPVGVVG